MKRRIELHVYCTTHVTFLRICDMINVSMGNIGFGLSIDCEREQGRLAWENSYMQRRKITDFLDSMKLSVVLFLHILMPFEARPSNFHSFINKPKLLLWEIIASDFRKKVYVKRKCTWNIINLTHYQSKCMLK